MKKICLCYLLILLSFSYGIISYNKSSIKKIPVEDQAILEFFFRSLFGKDGFGFTLFADKPVTIVDYNNFYFCSSQKSMRNEIILSRKGFKLWEKNKPNFLSQNYSFVKLDDNHLSFLLVNVKETKKVIDNHFLLFQNVLDLNLTKKEILNEIVSGEFFKRRNFRKSNYHIILGILFNFGQKNSYFFSKRDKVWQCLAALPYDLNNLGKEDIIKCLKHNINNYQDKFYFNKINEELILHPIEEFLFCERNTKFSTISQTNPFDPIKPLYFISLKNSEEEQRIIQNYKNKRQKLIKIYNSDKFLEIIWKKLTS